MKILKSLPFVLLLWSCMTLASFETYEFSTTQNEMRYFKLSKELRCPTCQNQNISDSDAPLAADLRRELHRMIEAGYKDEGIIDFMVSRYGDFVHYKPRIAPETYILWFGPFVLLLGGLSVVFFVSRNRRLRARKAQEAVRETVDVAPSVEAADLSGGLSEQERERLERLLQQDK